MTEITLSEAFMLIVSGSVLMLSGYWMGLLVKKEHVRKRKKQS